MPKMSKLELLATDLFVYSACLFVMPCAIYLLRFRSIHGWCSLWERIFLYAIARVSIEGDILEIGSFEGRSSTVIAAGNESSKLKKTVWLVEPMPMPNREIFLSNFCKKRLNRHVTLIDKTSEEARKIINAPFRFIFIDGNHDYEYVKKDIMLWQDLLMDGGIIAFHDRYYGGVKQAIEELIVKSEDYIKTGVVDSIFYAVKKNDNAYRDTLKRMERLMAETNKFMSFINKKKV